MKFSKKKFLLVAGLALLVPGAALTACGNVGNMDVDQVLPTDDPTSQKEIVFWHCMGHAKSNQVSFAIPSLFLQGKVTKYISCHKIILPLFRFFSLSYRALSSPNIIEFDNKI